MNITFEPVTDQKQTASDIRRPPLPTVTDFFEARHQLWLQGRESAIANKTTEQSKSRRIQPLARSSEIAEEAVYWFISAPALAYLLYLIFGL